MNNTTQTTPEQIANHASGSEKMLIELLAKAGAVIKRSYPAPAFELAKDDRKKLLQIHVQFPDGTAGFFAPGGPPRLWNYMFVKGT
jgi:hypothetical protein